MKRKNRLLAICYEYHPGTTPMAIRSNILLKYLNDDWDIEVITDIANIDPETPPNIHGVRAWQLDGLLNLARRLRLDKLVQWLVWPDDKLFWVFSAIRKARALIRQNKPDAVLVFIMPYAAGLAGVLIKRATQLPLLLNLDDSPTCTDMHPSFPSRLHFEITRKLEDYYVTQSDAIIYVSRRNLERVRDRQQSSQKDKFHLVRCGADPKNFASIVSSPDPNKFCILYIGGMSGWYEFYRRPEELSWQNLLYRFWMEWGRYNLTKLDPRGSSPVIIGRAVCQCINNIPEWQGKIGITIYGNRYKSDVVDRVLQNEGLEHIVTVHGPISNIDAIDKLVEADLLLITLPGRPDGTPGGRISAKTYEYLMTDRPILAAVPPGENWEYLQNKPGVWLTDPLDSSAMAEVITTLAEAKFSGNPLAFDRDGLKEELSYETRVREIHSVLTQMCLPEESSKC